MKRFLLASAFSLAAFGAHAQSKLLQAHTGGAPPGYTGMGDAKSGATAYFGVRAYTAAIAAAGTQPLYNIRRASDNHTCDILVATSGYEGNTANCSTGGDNGQSKASFLTATSGFVTTWYNQAGSSSYDAANATTGQQPTTLNTGCSSGSYGCLSYNKASVQVLGTSGTVTPPSPMTIIATGRRPTFDGSASDDIVAYGTGVAAAWWIANGAYLTGNGSTYINASSGLTDSSWHSAAFVVNGVSSIIYADAVSIQTGNTGTISGSAVQFLIGKTGVPSDPATALFAEIAIYPSALSSGDVSAISSNSHSALGF